MEEKRDLFVGIIVGLFSILYYIGALQIKMYKGLGVSVIDSSEVPKKWAIFLFLLSIMLIIRSVKRMKKSSEKNVSLAQLLTLNKEVGLTFILLAIYTVFLKQLGFVTATFLYIFFQTLVLTKKEKRNYKLTIILAIIFSVLIDYIFVELLSVLLPKGIIGF
ncbi:tripartite tricarboxylate transporter TctB family protein (plasmid) [Fusobacterium sp. SB021]|uniref:tripartite tricarboxylate transporter TctB family protein n=1 Tax=Fusobacterium sp. SB021 TaxID=2744227 RepID=UPI003CEC4D82